jgi:hypothetical protein
MATMWITVPQAYAEILDALAARLYRP